MRDIREANYYQFISRKVDDLSLRIAEMDERYLFRISESVFFKKLSKFLVLATYFGDGYLWGIIGLYLILFGGADDQNYVLMGLALSIVNIATFRLLKTMVERPRPMLALKKSIPPNRLKFRLIDSFSFPSGHATMAFGISYLISQAYPSIWAPLGAYLASAVIGLSRVYVREHFPSDVLAGAILGTFISIMLTPCFHGIVFP